MISRTESRTRLREFFLTYSFFSNNNSAFSNGKAAIMPVKSPLTIAAAAAEILKELLDATALVFLFTNT